MLIKKNPIDFYYIIRFEERFFQSDFEDDKYHYGRADRIISINSFVRYNFSNNVQIKLLGKYELRDTKSPFSSVIRSKEYKFSELGLSLIYKI